MEHETDTRTSFIDMLLSGQMNLFVLFILLLFIVNPVAPKKDGIESKAEIVVSLKWPDKMDCDMDLWVKGPDGSVAWWNHKDAGLMHLDHDDTGRVSESVVMNGIEYTNEHNVEYWTLRGNVPGEFIVNVHFYRMSKDCSTGVPVIVSLVKVNPVYTDIATKKLEFTNKGEEQTAFRFSLDATGNVTRTWDEPAEIVGDHIQQSQESPPTP